jgi:hypothetical protein
LQRCGGLLALQHRYHERDDFQARDLASVALTGDSCNTVLMPGKSCQFFAGTGAGTYTCRANTNGIDNHISGTMQLYNSADALLVTIPMAK